MVGVRLLTVNQPGPLPNQVIQPAMRLLQLKHFGGSWRPGRQLMLLTIAANELRIGLITLYPRQLHLGKPLDYQRIDDAHMTP